MPLSWKEKWFKVERSCYHESGFPVEKFKFNTLLPFLSCHLLIFSHETKQQESTCWFLEPWHRTSCPPELQQVSFLYELPSPGTLLYGTKPTKNHLCFYQHSRCLKYPLRPRLSLQLSVVPFKSSSESPLAVHLQPCRHAPACITPLFQPPLGAVWGPVSYY